MTEVRDLFNKPISKIQMKRVTVDKLDIRIMASLGLG
jgi:hypothetical protein